MKVKAFETIDNRILIVKNKKSAVLFELEHESQMSMYKFRFTFDSKTFKELVSYLETSSIETWGKMNLRDATSDASDYFEYYDKEFDNNGYLRISRATDNCLAFERPILESLHLYKFNKRKMETFLYDLKKLEVS